MKAVWKYDHLDYASTCYSTTGADGPWFYRGDQICNRPHNDPSRVVGPKNWREE